MHKSIKYGKRALWVLYPVYLVIIVVNVIFQLNGAQNNIIEASGVWGYIVTYGLSLLMAGGCFVICTVLQLVLYHFKKSKAFIPLLIIEAIKIAGTAIYIYMIDYANIRAGGLTTAFIVAGIAVFAVISVLEIALAVITRTGNENI